MLEKARKFRLLF